MKHLQATSNPIKAIGRLSYETQPAHLKMYHAGYEGFFNQMFVMQPADKDLELKVDYNTLVMEALAEEIGTNGWSKEQIPATGGFNRSIIALEEPQAIAMHGGPAEYVGGNQLVVAKWGEGFTSPVHGHTVGFLYEHLISGKMKVNTYRKVGRNSVIVRLVETKIVEPGAIAASYSTYSDKSYFKRETLIHSFEAVEPSVSLHYLSEYNRDGKDNTFKVDHFNTSFGLASQDVTRITSRDGMYLRKGDVALVRSTNVPEYGDHYIVITGHPVMKPHGLRVQDRAFDAPDTSKLLDEFPLQTGLTLLKLNSYATQAFHEFHGITIVNGEVVFPEA